MLLKLAYKLQPHQKAALNSKSPGQLLYFSTGSGKSLTSLAIADKEGGTTDVITPAALRENYKKEILKHNIPGDFNVQSYEGYSKTPGHGDTLVIDEAHRLGSDRERSRQVQELSQDYKKRVVMTASPIQNHPRELAPLMNIVEGAPITSTRDFESAFIDKKEKSVGIVGRLLGAKPGYYEVPKDLETFKKLWAGKVNYYQAPSSGMFPSVEEERISVEMDPEQKKLYDFASNSLLNPVTKWKIQKNLPLTKAESALVNAFYADSRQVLSDPKSYSREYKGANPKADRAVDEIIKHKKPQTMIYAPFIDSGLRPVADRLKKKRISHEIFSGELSDSERKAMIERYNTGKTKALLIGPAGVEGLDLKGTGLIQLLSPHWHQGRVDQVKGRGIRYGSHSHLPKTKQKVKVQYLTMTEKPGLLQRVGVKKKQTVEEYMENMSLRKKRLNDEFLNAMKEVAQ